jgi:hypothetical protein
MSNTEMKSFAEDNPFDATTIIDNPDEDGAYFHGEGDGLRSTVEDDLPRIRPVLRTLV